MRTFLLGVLALGLASCTQSSEPATSGLSSFFVGDGEKHLTRIANEFEIHHRLPQGYEVIVPISRIAELKALAPGATVIEQDVDAHLRNLPESWSLAYHDFAEVETHLKRVVANHPRLAKLERYGESEEGRSLFALKLSDNVEQDEEEPEVMLTSATHGNEIITVEVLLTLLDELVENYGKDERLTRMVDSREIYFLPVVSPDGFVVKSRFANGIDPNRDYPSPERPSHESNPCIDGILRFFHAHDIDRSIDFHSFGGLVMYPWAYTNDPVPEAHATRFENIAKKMAEASGYAFGQIPQILYPAKGSSVDYFFWKNETLALGVEIGDRHAPAPDAIGRYVTQNRESTWRFIEF